MKEISWFCILLFLFYSIQTLSSQLFLLQNILWTLSPKNSQFFNTKLLEGPTTAMYILFLFLYLWWTWKIFQNRLLCTLITSSLYLPKRNIVFYLLETSFSFHFDVVGICVVYVYQFFCIITMFGFQMPDNIWFLWEWLNIWWLSYIIVTIVKTFFSPCLIVRLVCGQLLSM